MDAPAIPEAEYGGYFLPLEAMRQGAFACFTEDSPWGSGWLLFENPSWTVTARSLPEVRPVLAQAEAACNEGRFAAGFVAYDAAPAFDSALIAQRAEGRPLACFHIYERAPKFYKELEPVEIPQEERPDWAPDISRGEFFEKLRKIRELLAAGATYQVNYSFRLTPSSSRPRRDEEGAGGRRKRLARLFFALAAENPPPHASLFLSEHLEAASLSPELFFEWADGLLRCRPMKGTALPGSPAEELEQSAKNRAENLMVVDMLRNDMGRIAEVGTVRVPKLFEVESYPTLLQMTSTVEAKYEGSALAIFDALFPCASIVGAPKVQTMREIAELEGSPRGLYTGAIGWMAPRQRAKFGVAIRTIQSTLQEPQMTYGVGSGIVWDSDSGAEWEECLLKTEAIQRYSKPWGLIETTRWTPQEGYWLCDAHFERMHRSALGLGIPFDGSRLEGKLLDSAARFEGPQRVRWVLGRDGGIEIEAKPLEDSPADIRARLARTPIRSGDPSLRLKTTRRAMYEWHLRESGLEEALLWNERGDLTEFCNGNLVAKLGGRWVTPPLECGLLAGTFREHLLQKGEIEERRLALDDLPSLQKLCRINSVRCWQDVELLVDRSPQKPLAKAQS